MPRCCDWRRKAKGEEPSVNFTNGHAVPSYAPDFPLRPAHSKVTINVDIPAKTANFKVAITFRETKDLEDGRRQVSLDGVNFSQVRVGWAAGHGDDAEDLQFVYTGEKVEASWRVKAGATRKPSPTSPREWTLEISYIVCRPVGGLYFGADYVITDNETEKARYWLVGVDYPSAPVTLEFLITAPKQYRIAANGKLLDQRTEGGLHTEHWRLDIPCPSYLTCWAVGDYDIAEEGSVHGMPLAYLGLRSMDGDPNKLMKLSFGKTPKMITWLEEKVGMTLPFPKYWQIAFPDQGGAMENISLVTWDEGYVVDEHLAKEHGQITESVTLHEMAHSYFGDLIICRHFEHSWLKESWATYMEAVWHEEQIGFNDFQYELQVYKQQYFEECGDYERPIVCKRYDSSWEIFDQHLYPGGAWRLHMLRSLLGDNSFWTAVRHYVKKHAGGFVETDDFRKALEESHGALNLTHFFDQWLYGKSYPKLKGSYEYDAEEGEVEVSFEQTQKTEGSANHEFFGFSLEVEVVVDGRRTVKAIDMSSGKGVVTFQCSAAPSEVVVDPAMKVLFSLDFNPGESILQNVVKNHKNSVAARVWAGSELAKGPRSAMPLLKEGLGSDSFYGVRAEVAVALANAKTPWALETLAEILDAETEHRGMVTITGAMGSARHPAVRRALLNFLNRPASDKPYKAHAAALRSLGAQGQEEDAKLLIQTLTGTPSYQGRVQVGAANGLGKICGAVSEERAWELLQVPREMLSKPRTGRAYMFYRPHLVGALGSGGVYLSSANRRRVIEQVTALLTDDQESVRKAAVKALVELHATSSREAIEGARATFPKQDSPWLDTQLKDLSKGDAAVSALQKEVAQLTAKLQSHDDALQKLNPPKPKENNGTDSKAKTKKEAGSCCETMPAAFGSGLVAGTFLGVLAGVIVGAVGFHLHHSRKNA